MIYNNKTDNSFIEKKRERKKIKDGCEIVQKRVNDYVNLTIELRVGFTLAIELI
jgi:hypothetical protein